MRLRPPRTLRGRVSAFAAAVIAVWMIVLVAGFYLVVASRIDGQLRDSVRVKAQAASAIVTVRAGVVTGVRESPTDRQLDSGIWVYSASRPIVKPRVPGRVQAAVDRLDRGRAGYARTQGHEFYVLPLRAGGQVIGAVIAGVATDDSDDTKRTVLIGSAVVSVLVLAGAYVVLRLATGRALRPVDAMAAQAAEWSVTAPAHRFGAGQRYAELAALAGRLDELLDRLAAVLRHERQLSGELSHELRTPLTRVMGEIDLLLADAVEPQRSALMTMRDGCEAMNAIIEEALATARTELAGGVGHAVLAEVLGGYAQGGTPRVVVDAAGLAVGVEGAVVSRIVAPVVENARRYAESEVHITARRVGGRAEIRVVNDGPRLAASDDVFEPGFTTGAADGHDGAGLGLALARRLARAADGDLTLDADAPLTTFVLVLPAG